ncbi:MAG: diaminopimelate epimerase [Dethiobacter sp.]|nr:diaminopimelate epimerase [Dethiobacter sp.]
MRFVKMHGLGNDFIFIEDFGLRLKDFPELARRLCHRHFGVGADGMVLLQRGEKTAFKMRIFNADGSEAEMCGNALRCAGKYLYERGLVCDTVMQLEMQQQVKTLRLLLEDGQVTAVEVNMGPPVLESTAVPVSGASRRVIGEEWTAAGHVFKITAVSMGNPHGVIFGGDPALIPLEEWGAAIETHPFFPRKANVEFVEVLSPVEARLRVFERGVGETLACGSGACAVLVAGVLNGLLARKASLHLPGGTLLVEWREDNHVYMTGSATEVFRGELVSPSDFARNYPQKTE